MSSRSKKNLGDILEEALKRLRQTEHFNEYLEYLNSEWYFTTEDLQLATKDPKVWASLKLPGRLKIELSSILNCSKAESSPRLDPKDSTGEYYHQASAWPEEPTHTQAPEAPEEDIKNGWVKCWSPEYECYYFYNTVSEESSWEDPLISDGAVHTYDVYQYSEAEQKWVAVEENGVTNEADRSHFPLSDKSMPKSPIQSARKSPDHKRNRNNDYKSPEGASLTFTRPKNTSSVIPSSSSNNSASGSISANEDRLFVHSPNRPKIGSGRKTFSPDKPEHKSQYRYSSVSSNKNNNSNNDKGAAAHSGATIGGSNGGERSGGNSGERGRGLGDTGSQGSGRGSGRGRAHKPIRLEMEIHSSDDSGSDTNNDSNLANKRPSPLASKPLARPMIGANSPGKSLRSCPKKSSATNNALSTTTGVHELDAEAKEVPTVRFRRHPSHMYDWDSKTGERGNPTVNNKEVKEVVGVGEGEGERMDEVGEEEAYNFYKDYDNTDAEQVLTEPVSGAYADAEPAQNYDDDAYYGDTNYSYDYDQSSKTVFDPNQALKEEEGDGEGYNMNVHTDTRDIADADADEKISDQQYYSTYGEYDAYGAYGDYKDSDYKDSGVEGYGAEGYSYEDYDYYPEQPDQEEENGDEWQQETADTEDEPDIEYNTDDFDYAEDSAKNANFDYSAYYNSYQAPTSERETGNGVAAELSITATGAALGPRSPEKAYEESLYHHIAEPSAPLLTAEDQYMRKKEYEDPPGRSGVESGQFRSTRAGAKQFTRHEPVAHNNINNHTNDSNNAKSNNNNNFARYRQDKSVSPSVRAPADASPIATPVRYDPRASLDDFLLVEASPAGDDDDGDDVDRGGYVYETDADVQQAAVVSNYDLMSMAMGSPGSNASPAVKQQSPRKQLQPRQQQQYQEEYEDDEEYYLRQQQQQQGPQKSKKSKITKLFRLNLFGKGPSLPSTPPPPRDNSSDADRSSSLNPHSSAYRQMKMEERRAMRKGNASGKSTHHSASGSSLLTGKNRDFPTQYSRHSSENLRNFGPVGETNVQENVRNSPPNPHIRRKPRPTDPTSAQAIASQDKYLTAHAQRLPESQRNRIGQRASYASKEEELHYRNLQRLIDMGFDESESILALSMCNDNIAEATQMLLDEHRR